jgi:hypothetical protein
MAQARSRSGGSATSARTMRTSAPSGRSRSASARQATPDVPARSAASDGGGNVLRTVGSVGKFAVRNVGVPVASAAIGAVAAVALEQRRMDRRRKVFGIPLPRRTGVDGLARSIGEAGKQFGKLADELRESREKAQQVGKALS